MSYIHSRYSNLYRARRTDRARRTGRAHRRGRRAAPATSRHHVPALAILALLAEQAKGGQNSANVVQHYFGGSDPGAFVSVSAGGILKTSKNAAAARQFLAHITSENGQAVLGDQDAEHRQRGGEDRRLAVLGEREVVLGPVEAQGRDREAERGVGLGVGGARQLGAVGQVAAHPDPLRALAREQEGGLHGRRFLHTPGLEESHRPAKSAARCHPRWRRRRPRENWSAPRRLNEIAARTWSSTGSGAAWNRAFSGVTTVRDSYGVLPALVATRDRINRGEATGARILAAGNIVGWGGPYSVSFSLIREAGLTLFQEQMNDQITQGAGEDLVDMTPDELRVAINAYLDKGPDFLKFGLSLIHI